MVSTTRSSVARASAVKPGRAGSDVPLLKPLTSLRFVAALLVVVHHFGMLAPAPVPRVFRVVLGGYLGVNFFFLLSGFILVYNYVDLRGRMRVNRYQFWVARFARIYPVYLVGFLAGALPYFWEQHAAVARLVTGLATLTLTQAWIPTSADVWNGPGWSLSVEAFFYLLFPLMAVYIARLNRPRLYLVCGACWAVCLAIGVLLGPFGNYETSRIGNAIVTYNPLLRLPEFILGAALGRLYILRAAPGQHRDGPRFATPELLALVALLGSAIALLWAPRLPDQLVHNGLFDPLFALLIYSLACSRGRLVAFLSTPLFVLLGEASYALYILHYPILQIMHHVLGHVRAVSLSSPGLCVVYVCICVTLSIASFRLFEQPARRAIKAALLSAGMRRLPGGLAVS